jgi:hypothetical protein
MTRKQSLSTAQIKQAKALYVAGKFGYGSIGKALGVPASTVRDILCGYSAYAVRVK